MGGYSAVAVLVCPFDTTGISILSSPMIQGIHGSFSLFSSSLGCWWNCGGGLCLKQLVVAFCGDVALSGKFLGLCYLRAVGGSWCVVMDGLRRIVDLLAACVGHVRKLLRRVSMEAWNWGGERNAKMR